MSRKPREFTVDSPLVIQIVQRPTGDWTIQPDPSSHQKMNDRLKKDPDPLGVLKNRILQEWGNRHPKKTQPEFISDPEHIPIMLREGEFVQIVCQPAYAFEVWSLKNPDVDPVAGTPTDPFGWNGAPQSVVAGGSLTAAVILPPVDPSGNPTQFGPRDQGFYKFRAIVHTTPPTLVDPDGYCDR